MAKYNLNKPKFVKELEANPEFAAYCKRAGLIDKPTPKVVGKKSSTKSTTKKSEGDK